LCRWIVLAHGGQLTGRTMRREAPRFSVCCHTPRQGSPARPSDGITR
jgi:hypothetical protein